MPAFISISIEIAQQMAGIVRWGALAIVAGAAVMLTVVAACFRSDHAAAL